MDNKRPGYTPNPSSNNSKRDKTPKTKETASLSRPSERVLVRASKRTQIQSRALLWSKIISSMWFTYPHTRDGLWTVCAAQATSRHNNKLLLRSVACVLGHESCMCAFARMVCVCACVYISKWMPIERGYNVVDSEFISFLIRNLVFVPGRTSIAELVLYSSEPMRTARERASH